MKFIKSLLILLCMFFCIVSFGCGGGSSGDDGDTGDYAASGYVQKGPFISGSSITIQELDDDLESTGATYETTTSDDFGTFSIGSQIGTRYVEVIATGFFFDEISGYLSMANLTLRAIADLSTQEVVNVNILTTLEKDRIKYLVTNEGLSFSEARTQAESEILDIFHVYDSDLSHFSEMDISQVGDSNSILLAISAILLSGNTSGEESESAAELSQFISYLNLDIKDDGILDSDSLIDQLTIKISNLNLYLIRENLENLYEPLEPSVSVPNFEDYIDSDNDGSVNIDDDDITSYVPENVNAFGGYQKVKIIWDSLSEAETYKIYWSTMSGVTKTNYEGVEEYDPIVRVEPPDAGMPAAYVDANTAYTLDGLANGTPYYYIVTGVSQSGYESLESDELTATPSQAEGTSDNPFYVGEIGVDIATYRFGADIDTYKYYYGHVDTTASYYRVDSVPSGRWINLIDLTDDVDLYVYEDSDFSVLLGSSTNSGTLTEACDLMGNDNTRYIKVTGSKITSPGGADFTFDILHYSSIE